MNGNIMTQILYTARQSCYQVKISADFAIYQTEGNWCKVDALICGNIERSHSAPR